MAICYACGEMFRNMLYHQTILVEISGGTETQQRDKDGAIFSFMKNI